MLDSKFNRIYWSWKTLIQTAERKDIEKEIKSLSFQCKEACDTLVSCIPSYMGLYSLEKIVCYDQFTNIYLFLNMIKLQDEQAYNNFTENHDIVNLKEYLGFEGKDFSKGITKLHALKEYSYFLSHLILRIYDEKDEAKKKEMLKSMM